MLSKWVFVILVLLLFNSCLTQEQRKQKAIEYGQKGFEADERRNYQEAIKYYKQGISLDSTNPNLYVSMGVSKYNMNDTIGAIADYKKALLLDSNSVISLYDLGLVYLQKNKYDSSIIWTKKLLSVDSFSLNAYLTLGIVYLKLKKYDSALYYLQMIAIKYPLAIKQKINHNYGAGPFSYKEALSVSYFYEGLCYKYLGNKKQAQFYLSLAMRDGIEGAKDSLNTLLK